MDFFKYLPVTVMYRGYAIEIIDGFVPCVRHNNVTVTFNSVDGAKRYIDEYIEYLKGENE